MKPTITIEKHRTGGFQVYVRARSTLGDTYDHAYISPHKPHRSEVEARVQPLFQQYAKENRITFL